MSFWKPPRFPVLRENSRVLVFSLIPHRHTQARTTIVFSYNSTHRVYASTNGSGQILFVETWGLSVFGHWTVLAKRPLWRHLYFPGIWGISLVDPLAYVFGVCPYALMPIRSMPICPYAHVPSAHMPMCPCAPVPICPYARMPVCACGCAHMPMCPYTHMPMFSCAHVPICVFLHTIQLWHEFMRLTLVDSIGRGSWNQRSWIRDAVKLLQIQQKAWLVDAQKARWALLRAQSHEILDFHLRFPWGRCFPFWLC